MRLKSKSTCNLKYPLNSLLTASSRRALLSEFEKNCIAEQNFKDAELAASRIQDLRAQVVEYKSVILREKFKAEVANGVTS